MHTLDLTGSARNHGQFGVKTLEVELTHHTVMSLLDPEHPRTGAGLFLDELAFPYTKEQLELGSLMFLVKQAHHSVVCQLDLKGFDAELAELFLDELEFPLGQAEPLRVLPKIGLTEREFKLIKE